jgi:hypothetical protein
MWLAIGFGCLPWWPDALALGSIAEHPIDWIVAAALTAALISVSMILSGCVTRFAEAVEKHYWLTVSLTIVLGLVLVAIEAGMTHHSLAWLDARKDLAPDWALWVISFGLSGFNVFALYTFGRDLQEADPSRDVSRETLALRRWQKAA